MDPRLHPRVEDDHLFLRGNSDHLLAFDLDRILYLPPRPVERMVGVHGTGSRRPLHLLSNSGCAERSASQRQRDFDAGKHCSVLPGVGLPDAAIDRRIFAGQPRWRRQGVQCEYHRRHSWAARRGLYPVADHWGARRTSGTLRAYIPAVRLGDIACPGFVLEADRNRRAQRCAVAFLNIRESELRGRSLVQRTAGNPS